MAGYTVATDGACKGNPGPAGWAWVGEDGHWGAGSIPAGTNNVGELLGLLNAITAHQHIAELTVQADSKYAIDTYSRWMDGHARRGWTTAAGKPVANRPILEDLIAARDIRRAAGLPDITLEHVRGHSGHRLNGWADERAVRASQHAAKGIERTWDTRADGRDRLDVTVDAPTAAEDRPQLPHRRRK